MNFELSITTPKVLAISLLTGMFSSHTSGFYYEEHKYVTQNALILTQKLDQLVINQSEIRKEIGSNFLCKDLLEPEPAKCFTIADLPALAGDHAGSPMLMQWKWFNDMRDPSLIIPAIDYLSAMRNIVEDECYSSESTISKIPKRSEFAILIHSDPSASSFGEDVVITKHDSNYLRSAAHNCNHFRNSNIMNVEQIKSGAVDSYETKIWNKPIFIPYWVSGFFESLQSDTRTREKPSLEASAWYAQLHAAALELASYPDPTNQAAAWIFETFALHFLQDGVSAGHVVTPSDGGLSALLVTKKAHDKYSEEGLKVTFENACIELSNISQDVIGEFLALEKACNEAPYEGVIYGDKQLVTQKSKLTKDLAIFLSYISLKEFGEAISLQKPLLKPQVEEPNYQEDPHWTFQGMNNEALAKILFIWWESGGRDSASSTMKLAAEQYFEAGKIKAVTMWPISQSNASTLQ